MPATEPPQPFDKTADVPVQALPSGTTLPPLPRTLKDMLASMPDMGTDEDFDVRHG